MKIELGKTYVTKMGTIVGIIEALPNPICGWVYRGDNKFYYSLEGKVSLKDDYDDSYDLVREYLGKDVEECIDQGEHHPGKVPLLEEVEDDMVNSPSHYLEGGVEAIDMIRLMLTDEEFHGYCKGNMLKYRLRAPFKGKTEEDVNKAAWYYEAVRGNK